MNGEEGADKIIRTSLVPYDYVQVGEKTSVNCSRTISNNTETSGKM